MAIATSIDALAVGVSFAALSVNIVSAAAFICCITFRFSFWGVFIGKKFGTILNNKAQILGGIIRIDNYLDSLDKQLEKLKEGLTNLCGRQDALKAEILKKEDYADRIEKIKQRLEKLDKKLGVDKNE